MVDSTGRVRCSRKFTSAICALVCTSGAITYNSGIYRADLISEIIHTVHDPTLPWLNAMGCTSPEFIVRISIS